MKELKRWNAYKSELPHDYKGETHWGLYTQTYGQFVKFEDVEAAIAEAKQEGAREAFQAAYRVAVNGHSPADVISVLYSMLNGPTAPSPKKPLDMVQVVEAAERNVWMKVRDREGKDA
jgi:hypothetical protein